MQIDYLPYIIPPVVGAVIGYVTNYVAIRMLFRPLEKWTILGLRVPLTPGIIPSKRGELAQKIGKMVGSHLLTADEVKKTLEKDRFRADLRQVIDQKLTRVLDRDLGPLISLFPQRLQGRVSEFIDSLQYRGLNWLASFLRSNKTEELIGSAIEREFTKLLEQPLDKLVNKDTRSKALIHIHTILNEISKSERLRTAIATKINQGFDSFATSQKPIGEFLPKELTLLVNELIEEELPPLLERFSSLLHDPAFRERITEKAKEAIIAFLDSLGGLSGLLSGFINMESIYDRLPGLLDKASLEISEWLKEEETRTKVATMLKERLELILQTPTAQLASRLPFERVKQIRDLIGEKAFSIIDNPATLNRIVTMIDSAIERASERSLSGIVNDLKQQDTLNTSKEKLTHFLTQKLRAPETKVAIEAFLQQKVSALTTEVPLGKLSSYIPADGRRELEDGIYEQAVDLLAKEVPTMVSTLNIRQIVEDKVNRLDILEVEDLILGIMKEQFRYINLFGALLGFFIGALNIFLIAKI